LDIHDIQQRNGLNLSFALQVEVAIHCEGLLAYLLSLLTRLDAVVVPAFVDFLNADDYAVFELELVRGAVCAVVASEFVSPASKGVRAIWHAFDFFLKPEFERRFVGEGLRVYTQLQFWECLFSVAGFEIGHSFPILHVAHIALYSPRTRRTQLAAKGVLPIQLFFEVSFTIPNRHVVHYIVKGVYMSLV